MLNFDKLASAERAISYHDQEYSDALAEYYAHGNVELSEWRGPMAAELGLSGAVERTAYEKLVNGQAPDGTQLVRHRQGEGHAQHIVGWDLTFSAPKSVSAQALLAGDRRIRVAHEAAARAGLELVGKYVEARLHSNQTERTGHYVAAVFHHDTARPVNGMAAPQLHDHTILFNATRTADGKTHALQTYQTLSKETVNLATAVYRAELSKSLRQLGYRLWFGEHNEPQIEGYSPAFIERLSDRDRQAKDYAAKHGVSMREAVLRSREAKLSPEEGAQQPKLWREEAQKHGVDVDLFREQALARGPEIGKSVAVEEAVRHAIGREYEREAVTDERKLLEGALIRGQGRVQLPEARAELEGRIESGDLKVLESVVPRGRVTTKEMIGLERCNLEWIQAGKNTVEPLAVGTIDQELTPAQQQAVKELLESRDRVIGFVGVAGSGKSQTLNTVRQAAELQGFVVLGMAPTSRAARALSDSAGIRNATTLQAFLMRKDAEGPPEKRLLMVDEASLASTRMVAELRKKVKAEDRVVFVGDTRQHQSVEAGRFLESAITAGMITARLEEIMRQKDEGLKHAVELLAVGNTKWAVGELIQQGRVQEVRGRRERIQAIVKDYASSTERALVISPDIETRGALNQAVRTELRARGMLSGEDLALKVLVDKGELTGADRQVAGQYQLGDVLRYTKGSKSIGVSAGEYVRVLAVDGRDNLLTVRRSNGQEARYDPRRLQGVSVFREAERKFAVGERVQFTMPWRREKIANRELGTVEKLDVNGNLAVKLDGGRGVQFNIREHPHLDHGYATTSFSAQGLTSVRALLHVETSQSKQLVNQRLGYVGVSRASHDVQVYTNDAAALGEKLARKVTKESALEMAEGLGVWV
jgi:conjugative relaxase-like TrwC/TraI family protein